MNKQDQLEELLVDWGLQRQQGNDLTVEELCKDCPELAPDLATLISDIKATDRLEDDADSDGDFLRLPDFSTVSGHADETRLPGCEVSLDEFCQRLIDSELMGREQVRQLRQRIAAEDARSFARQLVAVKKLTRFQATVLLEGRDIPLVLDRYVLLGEIGKGGMGAVYKALHQRMDRVVALKILPKEAVDSPEKVKRFHREVKAAAKLEHQNIVTAHDARYTEDFTPTKRFENDEHTLALYHFDEGQGDFLTDSSGNGHHGKIVGAKWVRADEELKVIEEGQPPEKPATHTWPQGQ